MKYFILCACVLLFGFQTVYAQGSDNNGQTYVTQDQLKQVLGDFDANMTEKLEQMVTEKVEEKVSEKIQNITKEKCLVCSVQNPPISEDDIRTTSSVWGAFAGAAVGVVSSMFILFFRKQIGVALGKS